MFCCFFFNLAKSSLIITDNIIYTVSDSNSSQKHGATVKQGGAVRLRGVSLWPFSSWSLPGLQGPLPAVNPGIGLLGKDTTTHLTLFARLHCANLTYHRQELSERHRSPRASTGQHAEHPFILSLATEVFQSS